MEQIDFNRTLRSKNPIVNKLVIGPMNYEAIGTIIQTLKMCGGSIERLNTIMVLGDGSNIGEVKAALRGIIRLMREIQKCTK